MVKWVEVITRRRHGQSVFDVPCLRVDRSLGARKLVKKCSQQRGVGDPVGYRMGSMDQDVESSQVIGPAEY